MDNHEKGRRAKILDPGERAYIGECMASPHTDNEIPLI